LNHGAALSLARVDHIARGKNDPGEELLLMCLFEAAAMTALPVSRDINDACYERTK
jgi:hypothetical protein